MSDDAFHEFQAGVLAGETRRLGVAEGWAAPVAVYDAPSGFGEEVWLASTPVTVLSSRLAGSAIGCCHGKGSGRTSLPSTTALIPKGAPNHYEAKEGIRFAQIYLTDTLVDRVGTSLGGGERWSDRLRDDLAFVPDRTLDALVDDYLRASSQLASTLEMEARAILLVSRLVRAHHDVGPSARHPARGGLAPWQLRRATEAMEVNLCGDIGLDMLANVVGCSPTHFSRAFKRSTGVPPFQWLLERRIARAKDLLADARLPLADVALAVGFSAQPQFTTAFRRVVGTTPGAWRRERLS